MFYRKLLICGAVAFLAGCAERGAQTPDEGFADVRQAVAQRTGQVVQWRGHGADDAAVDAALHELLSRDLTADTAVAVAMLNNRELQATYEDLGIAQADLVQAGLLKNPILHIERRFPGQAAELDVAQEFLDVLLIPMRKRVAAAEFEAVKMRVAQEAWSTAADVRAAFYTFQGAGQLVEMRQAVAQSTDAAAQAARHMHDAGNITLLDWYGQRKLAAEARLELTEAQTQAVEDRGRLTVLMGLWGADARWKAVNRLPDVPDTPPSLDALESRALKQRLDLAARRRQIEADAAALGITRTSRYVPDLALEFHYEHDIEPLHSQGPGVDLALPLWDQGKAGMARGQAVLEQSRRRYAALGVEIASEVRTAYARMAGAASRARRIRREVLPLGAKILEQTQLQYNGMFVGVVELLRAKQAQIQAGQQYIEALRDYWVGRTELERAVGGRLAEAPATQESHNGGKP